MFERSHLEQLAAFAGENPVVSLYLNLPPRFRNTPEAYRARLKGLLKEAAGRAPEADIAAIEDYFEREFDWNGRSVVVFSGAGDDLWVAESFSVPLPSNVYVGPKPFIMPLAGLMDNYGSYAVALVDQQSARLFHYHLGELVESEEMEGEEIKRLKAGGGARGRARGDDLSGYSAEAARGNLRRFAERLASFCRRANIEHVLLGGTDTTLHQFREMLPQVWQDRVEGMFNIAMRAADGDVLEQSLDAMRTQQELREVALVEQIRTLAAKGGAGVVGIKETREASEAGRVQTLVLAEGAVTPEEAEPVIARVLDYGGAVEFVGEESVLAGEGGIGALLRY